MTRKAFYKQAHRKGIVMEKETSDIIDFAAGTGFRNHVNSSAVINEALNEYINKYKLRNLKKKADQREGGSNQK